MVGAWWVCTPSPAERAPCGSKSTASTRRPYSARLAPRLIVVGVLPTPPLLFPTAMVPARPPPHHPSGGWGTHRTRCDHPRSLTRCPSVLALLEPRVSPTVRWHPHGCLGYSIESAFVTAPAGAPSGTSPAACPRSRACKSALSRRRRAQEVPARPAHRLRPRAHASQTSVAGWGGVPPPQPPRPHKG